MILSFFPLIGAAIGWFIVAVSLRLIKSRLKAFALAQFREELTAGLNALDTGQWLSPLIDQHMNTVITRFKEQMPWMGIFLTEGMSQAIRDLSRDEILKAWPDMRATVEQQILIQAAIEQRLFNPRVCFCLKVFGALIGFCEGLLFFLILRFGLIYAR